MLPAGFDTESFARAIADFARHCADRRGFDRRRNIDCARCAALDGLQFYSRDQAGGDERAAQIINHCLVVQLAGAEARDDADMLGVERGVVAKHPDRADAPLAA